VQEDLAARFKQLPEWESRETQPTLKQVEKFARDRERERTPADSCPARQRWRQLLSHDAGTGEPTFSRALVVSTLEGQTLYRDAFRMLDVSTTKTFNSLDREVGLIG